MISTDVKNILGLQLPTDPRWVDLAGISLEAILTDHAYCEQKAALTCNIADSKILRQRKTGERTGASCNGGMGAFPAGAGRAAQNAI